MTEAKLVVIYPHPKGFEAFEKAYASEHLPLVVAGQSSASYFRDDVAIRR